MTGRAMSLIGIGAVTRTGKQHCGAAPLDDLAGTSHVASIGSLTCQHD
jgi:hypothetical protein